MVWFGWVGLCVLIVMWSMDASNRQIDDVGLMHTQQEETRGENGDVDCSRRLVYNTSAPAAPKQPVSGGTGNWHWH